jgi:hypothetical protein
MAGGPGDPPTISGGKNWWVCAELGESLSQKTATELRYMDEARMNTDQKRKIKRNASSGGGLARLFLFIFLS